MRCAPGSISVNTGNSCQALSLLGIGSYDRSIQMHRTRSVALTISLVGILVVALTPSRDAGSQTAEPRVVEVVVRRFAFEPATIDAVEGERLRVLVRSADGPHGFEIKRFKVSKEVPRGTDPVPIEFTASEVGTFPILCSLFCGDGHDDMKGALVVTARPVARR